MLGIQRRINYSSGIQNELLKYNVLGALIVSLEFKLKVLGENKY